MVGTKAYYVLLHCILFGMVCHVDGIRLRGAKEQLPVRGRPMTEEDVKNIPKMKSPVLNDSLFYNDPLKPPDWLVSREMRKPGVPMTPPPPPIEQVPPLSSLSYGWHSENFPRRFWQKDSYSSLSPLNFV